MPPGGSEGGRACKRSVHAQQRLSLNKWQQFIHFTSTLWHADQLPGWNISLDLLFSRSEHSTEVKSGTKSVEGRVGVSSPDTSLLHRFITWVISSASFGVKLVVEWVWMTGVSLIWLHVILTLYFSGAGARGEAEVKLWLTRLCVCLQRGSGRWASGRTYNREK